MLKKKKILISGATGFIGANLARKSLEAGNEVYIISRAASDKWRISDILKILHEFSVDLLDYERLESVICEIKPEIIFHTAIYGGYPFQKNINKTIQTNFIGTANLIEACSKIGFENFVNTGSSSEYGQKNAPMKERDSLDPDNIYGASKAGATLFCRTKSKFEKLPITTLRLFSPYGYYEESSRLVPSVILSCLKKENPMLSSPESVRDFVFIDDVIDAYFAAAKTPNVVGEIFNIGGGRQSSIKEVVNKILGLMESDIEPQWGSIPERSNEPKIWQADISKARTILNWQPKHSLWQGLGDTVKWFEKNISLYEETISAKG